MRNYAFGSLLSFLLYGLEFTRKDLLERFNEFTKNFYLCRVLEYYKKHIAKLICSVIMYSTYTLFNKLNIH